MKQCMDWWATFEEMHGNICFDRSKTTKVGQERFARRCSKWIAGQVPPDRASRAAPSKRTPPARLLGQTSDQIPRTTPIRNRSCPKLTPTSKRAPRPESRAYRIPSGSRKPDRALNQGQFPSHSLSERERRRARQTRAPTFPDAFSPYPSEHREEEGRLSFRRGRVDGRSGTAKRHLCSHRLLAERHTCSAGDHGEPL